MEPASPYAFDSLDEELTAGQIRGGDLAARTLSLTFDDGPGPRTAELARYLAAEGIRATFFMVGKNARGQEALLEEVQSLGHLVANHSFNHEDMRAVAAPVSEISDTHDVIAPWVSGSAFLFRAPYGAWNAAVAALLNQRGFDYYVGPIFWDIGGEMTSRYAADWACWNAGRSAESCGQSYLNEIHDRGRGIVLAHDTHSRTIDMVKWLVPRLKAEGYEFVRVDEVPAIAAAVTAAGGEPGVGAGDEEGQILGPIECPAGYSLIDIGSQGGKLCVDGTNAWGPFTQGMVDQCRAWGGGDACQTDRWGQRLAISARGDGLCPRGASFDSETRYCQEAGNAFGPFPAELVARCIRYGGGETTCRSARWNRNFLAALLR